MANNEKWLGILSSGKHVLSKRLILLLTLTTQWIYCRLSQPAVIWIAVLRLWVWNGWTLLGVEFLMSTQAFYCSLCDVFLGSCTCAETHCKSDEHNEKYAVSAAAAMFVQFGKTS